MYGRRGAVRLYEPESVPAELMPVSVSATAEEPFVPPNLMGCDCGDSSFSLRVPLVVGMSMFVQLSSETQPPLAVSLFELS